jgi:hypothetical protein
MFRPGICARAVASKISVLQRNMTSTRPVLTDLSDDQLLGDVKRLACAERHATAALIRALMEIDVRRLYLREGCSSLFTYCTQVLHLAEGAAYNRIEATRAARRHPAILDALEEGSLTLTSVRLLAPHLTDANQSDVLAAARYSSKRDVEKLIAALNPQPAVASTIRKLPVAQIDSALTAPSTLIVTSATVVSPIAQRASAPFAVTTAMTSRATVTPLAPERYKVQVTFTRETHDKLRRVQDLARPTPSRTAISQLFSTGR